MRETIERLTILAPVALVVGLLGAIEMVPRVREIQNLGVLDGRTVSVDGECGPYTGGWVDIEVDGQRHRCTVGIKCGDTGTEVAYDLNDPSQCRAAADLERLGPYEGLSLSVALTAIVAGTITGLLVVISWRRRQAELDALAGEDE